MRFAIILFSLLLFSCANNPVDNMANRPFADIHLHYNWDQEELVEPQQALQILRDNHVELAVVFSTPSEHALRLANLDKQRIIPFFSPYTTVRGRSTWFREPQVLKIARDGLEKKIWQGIGELHVVSGMGPRRDNPVLQGLLKLSAEFNVPFNIHTDAGSYEFLMPICQQHQTVRFLWAHAGGNLGPEHSEAIIKACPNVRIELSARDPWHYGGLVDDNKKLRKAWKQLLLRYPDHFMTGTDPVWNAHQRDRWYEADEGWLHYQDFINFHRKWLAELPEEVAEKIRYKNAMRFFGRGR